MSQPRSLNFQSLALVLGSGIGQIFTAGLYILTARAMSPVEFGPVVTAVAMGGVGAALLDCGSGPYWVRELASRRIAQDELNSRASARFVIALVLAAVVVIVALLVAPLFVATGVLMITMSTGQTLLVPLRGAMRAETVAWLVASSRAMSLVFYFGQVALGVTPGLALWTSLALGDLVLAFCAYVVTPAAHRLIFRVNSVRNPWAGARWYAVGTVGTSAALLELPIVAALAGPGEAGIFGGVNRWIQPMSIASAAFASAAAPFLAAATRIVELRGQLLRASWSLFMTIAYGVTLFLMAPRLVAWLLGDSYSESAKVLQLLALAALLNTLNQPLTVALQARRLDHVAAALIALTAATQLIVVSLLAPSLGALGAGIGGLVAQIVALVATLSTFIVIARRRSQVRVCCTNG